MEQVEQVHKRRVRYKGTHPRKFSEKYKEHNPEKYADTIAHIKSKGSTPAGMHLSICVDEILDFLRIQPGEKGLDATLGYGGHSTAMLQCLQGSGHLYGLDIDPIEIIKTKNRLESRGFGSDILTILHQNFGNLAAVATAHGPFDFMLADLGVSSMQIDNPERGFSYKTDGPLDLRLNPEKGISAAERLQTVSFSELEGMLIENADEPYATEIARAVLAYRKRGQALNTTTDLRRLIEETLSFLPPRDYDKLVKKACQRTFQALRIDVNSEFEVLEAFLDALPEALAPGGRIAILTFHSGEDRLVKKAFKTFYKQGLFKDIAHDVIRPSTEECNRNGRARCTKMRWAIRA